MQACALPIWIREMRVICVAITEMETELHDGRQPGRDLDHSADQCLEIADRCQKDTLEDGELKRGIPLYRQLIGRYGGENLVEFAPHRCAIERLDGLETSRFDERHHRREGRRQRNHEAGAARDLPGGKPLTYRPKRFEHRPPLTPRRE